MNAPQKNIVLGVGAGIAAYKSCELLRRLQDHGYSVTVVPTPSSLNFVGTATWEALSGKPVTTSVFESVDEVRHVQLAKETDAILIAPATADLIARITHGRADDLLTNTVLAATVPVVLVPAMHSSMWTNPATQSNIAILRSRGILVIEPDTGALTSGDSGVGRFPEVPRIISEFEEHLGKLQDFKGKKVLISAGGTREPIDPVRFIGNRSSGKQGIALAREATRRGAITTLVASNIPDISLPGVEIINVETAAEMHSALAEKFHDADVLVMAAAVADARPKNPSVLKIKKNDFSIIELEKNPDIIADLATGKTKQIICAFAAESSEDKGQARQKLKAKGADFIYLNSIADGAVFGSNQTQGWLLDSQGPELRITPGSKDTLARLLFDQIKTKLGYANV